MDIKVMKKQIIFTTFAIFLALATLVACDGGSSSLPDLSGTYACNDYGFPIGSLTFWADGTVDLSMDWEYTGTYKKRGNEYVISITGGKSSVSEFLAKERNNAYKITVTRDNSAYDSPLTVHIKAKSGYMYYGNESAIFYPQWE